ncbi:double-strand break repair helicase AddA [Alsobacter sp. R-9]
MSTGRLFVPPETRDRQRRASDPRTSAWVSANAGSGKTFVLSRRVVRLLLDGVDPSTILSLTFTKAAAANMANRVFEILGGWVTMTDAGLSQALLELDGQAPSPARLAMARRLFARAVETPGGLKIQTIHAFCERLLHLFPFEANVSAAFEVLDDAAAAEMLAEARHALLDRAASHPDGPEAQAVSRVEKIAGQSGFETLMSQALGLRSWLREHARGDDGIAAYHASLAGALGIGPDETPEDIERAITEDGIPPSEWEAVAASLDAFSAANEAKQAERLRAAVANNGSDRAEAYLSVFLTAEEQARKSIVGKPVQTKLPDLAARLAAEQQRVLALVDRRRAAATLAGSVALARLAEAVARRYEQAKSARGVLDFDDLVSRTLALLARSDAAWVLYKLDQGIEHILVDEAQDTSHAQWEILTRIAEEFVSGDGRNPRLRTVFAVGDAKQSIFSFQGADPRVFEAKKVHFERRFRALRENAADPARWGFDPISLNLSFRSAPEILNAVDAVFAEERHFRGLSSDPGERGTSHQSARPDAVGRVDLWPTVTPTPAEERGAWDEPLDTPAEAAPPVQLAERIAALIDHWRQHGDDEGRRIRPGDVLILVRRRGPFFEAVIRALKSRGVPVAGADRLALTEHIAVLDLIALGRSSLLPQDDLTLATVLKSPLFGVDEETLFSVAHGREGSLARAIATRAEAGEQPWATIQADLQRFRTLAREAGPFQFYARVLGPGRGRLGMLSRLGSEAGDAVDEFLRLALDHEQRRTPSLPLFLDAVDGADITIRRDMEDGRDEVRVMTVHGAKGLEAPVVFLADTCTVPQNDARILRMGGEAGLPVWSRGAKVDPAAVRTAREEEAARIREEYHRLLYVGLTRAKDRLIVAGFETSKGRAEDCWYDMVHRQLAPLCETVPAEDGRGDVLRYQPRPSPAAAPVGIATPAPAPLRPAWLDVAAPAEAETVGPIRPSKALAAADSPPRAADTPFLRDARAAGILVHRILEVLPGVPRDGWRAAATALAAARGADLTAERRSHLVDQALALLGEPSLAPLFGPGSRAEAALAGRLTGSDGKDRPVWGQVDRLAITPTEVIVADYKTTARPPASPGDIPEQYVGQLAVYRALVSRVVPGRPVRCLLVWTSGPVVMTVPEDRLDAALARITAA